MIPSVTLPECYCSFLIYAYHLAKISLVRFLLCVLDRSGEHLSHPMLAALAILVVLGGIAGIASANMCSEGLREDIGGNGEVPLQLSDQRVCIRAHPWKYQC